MVITLKHSTPARRATYRTDISDIGIIGVNHDVTALAGPNRVTINPVDTAIFGSTWDANTGIILLCGVDTIGEAIISFDAIKLCCQLIIDGCPALASVERDACTAIIAFNHALRIARIDPQIVIVPVRCCNLREGTSPVG